MAKLINEIGNTYGYLTVIGRAENDSEGRARWLCKCKCGQEVVVRGKTLRNGNTKSCGCYQKERATQSNLQRGGSLVGQKFGKLLVLSEAGFKTKTSGRNSRLYNCLCDCGNLCIKEHVYLAQGETVSCGCLRSKGEFQIASLLKEHNIDFKQEYSFDNLNDVLPLRFDFALFEEDNLKCLIEFQGEQHWQKSNGFYSEDLVKHDQQKEEYCKNNNIPLIKFYYKKDHNITWEELSEKIGSELSGL